EFTDVVYVGVGNPVMILFLQGSDNNRVGEGAKGRGGDPIRGMKIEIGRGKHESSRSSILDPRSSATSVPRPLAPEGPAQWFQPPQLHVSTTLAEPVTENPMIHFDWRQATVRCQDFDWQIVADGQVLAPFGSRELEARQAL